MEIVALNIFEQSADTFQSSGYFSAVGNDFLVLIIAVVAAYVFRIAVHLIFHDALIRH